MAVFKFVISEPSTRKSFQMEVDQSKAVGLIGKKLGDDFNGDLIGLGGYVLTITGGTDKDGFPMHPRLKGRARKKLLLAEPPGFHPSQKGQRKRKMVRGDTISEDIVQINVKVTKVGDKPFEQFMTKKEKPKKEEPKKEETKEEQPVEEKPKEKKPAETPKESSKEEPTKKQEEKPKAAAKKPTESPKPVKTTKPTEEPKKALDQKTDEKTDEKPTADATEAKPEEAKPEE